NPGAVAATVSIDLYRAGENNPAFSFPSAIVVQPGRRASLPFSSPRTEDDDFTLVFTSTQPLYVVYSMVRSEGVYGGAAADSPATDYHFAEGFTDPARTMSNVLEESLRVFNPYSPALGAPQARDAHTRYTFRYTD